ncbi:MAG: amidohydrolase family protein, partial [Actinomycetota bacterium]|nr:amidohydrolase family protein [Actinomycetota bacterium]
APLWADLKDLPPAARAARLRRDDVRRALVANVAADRQSSLIGGRLITKFHLMFPLGDPPDYEPDPASSIAAVAERQGRSPAEVAYDVLLGDDATAMLYLPTLNYVDGSLDAVGAQLSHPASVAGLSDGGAHVGTICDVSFPTTLLQWWGRDRPSGRLPVELLVHKQTQATAQTVGLLDRGVLAPGYRGDVNVIDFDRLGLHAPEIRYDLPAGGRRLVQRADGYVHTFVAGTEIRADGESTGATPGRLVRGAQPAPTPA